MWNILFLFCLTEYFASYTHSYSYTWWETITLNVTLLYNLQLYLEMLYIYIVKWAHELNENVVFHLSYFKPVELPETVTLSLHNIAHFILIKMYWNRVQNFIIRGTFCETWTRMGYWIMHVARFSFNKYKQFSTIFNYAM